MQSEHVHKPFCFAGQYADCEGYFPDDIVPCVCGSEGAAITALANVTEPFAASAQARGQPRISRDASVFAVGITRETESDLVQRPQGSRMRGWFSPVIR